jgi:hypothetical protein
VTPDVRFGPTRACPSCGQSIQTARASGCIDTRFDAGTWTRHRCIVVRWCGDCATPRPIYTRALDGLVLDVATDQLHTCSPVAKDTPARQPSPVVAMAPAPQPGPREQQIRTLRERQAPPSSRPPTPVRSLAESVVDVA